MIVFLMAMREEALPLIGYLGLQRSKQPTLFPVFRNGDTWLTVSGVGKVNAAAAATALFHVAQQARDAVWLNVGIAGHADLPVGTLRSAHTVTDRASGARWYPPQVLLAGIASSPLTSVDTPELGYPDESLYDMEGAGFYPAALRCSTAEAVQCLKVVSDTREHSVEHLSPRRIGELIDAHREAIADTGAALREATDSLRSARDTDPDVAALLTRHRFSVTQQRQLTRLAQRLAVRAPGQPLIDEAVARARSSRAVLRALQQRLDTLPMQLRTG